jgi:malate dehydrogenase (oxaloacetate-decarboxylating)
MLLERILIHMVNATPTVSYSITLRLEIKNVPGMFGKVTSAIGSIGGDIGAVDIVGVTKSEITRDITVNARGEKHGQEIIDAVKKVPGVKIVNVSDRVFLLHLGGKIRVENKVPLKTRHYLSMAYTPGVARVCQAIHDDPIKVYTLTIKKNCVAVVTDGTAVLGLGDIGPEAAMPVMEGKAMLFKEFGGIDAFPICLDTKDPDEIVRTVQHIAPGFGGINLEDISSPRCFEIEARLKQLLDIPVFHDDQHGTAVVVLAALLNALKIVKKEIRKISVAISGAGAAGVAVTKVLRRAGVRQIICCDRYGAIYKGRSDGMNVIKEWLADHTNPRGLQGPLSEAMRGADVFIGVSGPGLVKPKDIKAMKRDAVVFALANPVPEIMPEEATPYARVIATGRSDYPNQINNVLCFPGMFRGALDCRAREINEAMKLAAAQAIASVVHREELTEEYIIPSVFNPKVAKATSQAVVKAALKTGVAQRSRVRSRLYYF